jgi:lipopolysaccharide/colanic/teichoic acid biosynthesis glycosyltransferase
VRGRTTLGFTEMLRLDCEYVRRASLTLDLIILARTVPAVLATKGAR